RTGGRSASGRRLWSRRDPSAVGCGRPRGRGAADARGVAVVNDSIDVMVTGGQRRVARGATLLELLRSLELDPRVVVVEHNRAIVRRPRLGDVMVAPG